MFLSHEIYCLGTFNIFIKDKLLGHNNSLYETKYRDIIIFMIIYVRKIIKIGDFFLQISGPPPPCITFDF